MDTTKRRENRPEDIAIDIPEPNGRQPPATQQTTTPVTSSVEVAPPVVVARRSYQLRALSRKTLSYQKRQTLVNICCVAICPFIMVCGRFYL